ncbi:hypothetical protein A2872_03770 [Candidatus Gottesmanbacteria bacterium RIFCSPHIGHO2_01_FULL_42_12]|uniref:50S ribosomal protein L22 n=1 Tax=Candidatus Gottesmanbacteria bacterium RIFCSPHIGHO2_01_FULL_42_12 TaxID=1798377 RepID=A0A1F5Z4C8_9BACT|nr:MAG: hypothetical protein A2872_03770 [Candidatus Gottesmanbacteria bacterium RIFCSPHIGHO2_01_FULL_42_12]
MKSFVKNVRVSPRKMRILAKDLVGKPVVEVMAGLKFVNRSARPPILSALESALANATNNGKVGTETLIVKNVIINEGMKMKRAAKGRNARTDRGTVVKRTSHLKIVLEEKGVSNGTKN